MKGSICLLLLGLVAATFGADIRSANTFALTTVSSSSLTNTIIAVPWRGCNSDIRVDRLVWPQALTTGDMLLAVTSGVTYAAWELQNVPGSASGAKCWTPIATVQRPASGTSTGILSENEGSGTIACGNGLFLVRQKPVGAAFSLYGIWREGEVSVAIKGGTATEPSYTLLASPDTTRAVDLNTLAWPVDKIGAKDTLVVPLDAKTTRNYLWDAKQSKWYYGRTSVQNGAIATEYVYDLAPIPAGTGFWYVRRAAGDLTLTFN